MTTYTYEGKAGVQGTAALSSGLVGSEVGARANLAYSERPTISDSPLSGQEFTLRLMTPIPARALFGLAQAGWAVGLLLLTAIQRMNDTENMAFTTVPPPGVVELEAQARKEMEKLEAFRRVIGLFISLADAEIIEVDPGDDREALPSLLFLPNARGRHAQDAAELKRLLGLEPERHRFRFTSRLTERRLDEINIQTRSLMAIMGYVAQGIPRASWCRPRSSTPDGPSRHQPPRRTSGHHGSR